MTDDGNFRAELTRPTADTAIVEASGDVDLNSSGDFLDCLSRAVKGASCVIVDLTPVTFLDSAGLGALIKAHRQASEAAVLATSD